jgi:glycosyltransferase involved in cell wall biosynthesis
MGSMTEMGRDGKTRVAILYHYIPHYRKAVCEELMRSKSLDVLFVAGEKAPASMGLRLWKCPDPKRFVASRRYTVCVGRTPEGCFPRYLAWQTGLIRLALRGDIDAFLYFGDVYTVSLWISVAIARLRKKPVHIWTIGWLRDERGLKDRLRRFLFGLGDSLLLYGHFARREAIKRGFAPERLHVVYNSLDYPQQKAIRDSITVEELNAIRSELFPTPERPLLTCCSRLQPHRRLDLMIDAAARLQEAGHPCNVLLIGDGTERGKLQEQAERLGVSARFYGACYEEETLAHGFGYFCRTRDGWADSDAESGLRDPRDHAR